MNIQAFKNLFKHESSSGILLILSAVLAIIMANSPLSSYYNLLIDTPVNVSIDTFSINKPLLLWVNDGLMALFFLLVGLELKREFVEGELSDKRNIILPALGAIGGMAVPAIIYVFLNKDDPAAIQGWAIPAATDIAFALGILSLLGSRVPITLKIFLTSVAIFDDVGAIIIIALFYTSKISLGALIFCLFCMAALWVMNKTGIERRRYYLYVGLLMWIAMLKSGVHATLAGAVLALFIPITTRSGKSPLKTMEHELHSMVSFFILPFFAFCNAGLYLGDISVAQITHSIPAGIALGLFVGKQVGVFGLCWLGIQLGLTKLPNNMTWGSLYGIAALCGVGFTMSLFIGSLAFDESGVGQIVDERLGILLGSIASGLLGYFVLWKLLPETPAVNQQQSDSPFTD
ncbi:MAG: NhaA family Na+:H+ antiporter [Cellvibrionaceae bacterium]|jgi:NhaA family Na+:H+ antiporter